MKCIVPGANVKILAKAMHALAKIGDEMYVEPSENSLSFRSVNLANSAYANFTFHENYFSYYAFGELQDDDVLKCKILMRSAMAVFKGPSTMEKQVESCQIRLEPNASKLIFMLKYRNGITKTHLLPIVDCGALQAVYTKDGVPNQLVSQPRILSDATQNFQQNLLEITLQVTQQKVHLRNYIDETSDISKVTRTQLALSIGEFDRYTVGTETSITFCMKEFKATLSFAEAVGSPIGVYFESAGRPVVFVLKNTCFEVNVVLSTLNPDLDTQSDAPIARKRNQSVKKKPTNKKSSKSFARPTNWQSRNQSSIANRTAMAKATPAVTNGKAPQKKSRDSEGQMDMDPSDDLSIMTIDDRVLDNTNPAYSKEPLAPQNAEEENSNSSSRLLEMPSSSGVSSRANKTSAVNKEIVRNVFGNIAKRKSNVESSVFGIITKDDIVPTSPPPHPKKKARMIFQKCFQATFDPRMLPGHDVILVEDSDENSD